MAESPRGAWPRPGLAAMAAGAWASWLAWLGLMAAMLAAGPWHPHFLPATAVFGLFVVTSLAVLVDGLWRLACGPGRRLAAAWLLLGVAPALFASGHLLYGLRKTSSRLLALDPPIKLLAPFGESIMDLEARFRYPERTEGETVVMIAAPSPIARNQVAAMDEHVRALRARLGGRAIVGKVHWIRGPLLGADGRATLGMGMGSRAGEVGPEDDPLPHVDRHEVAHCVLNGIVPILEIDPPALLVEGWAEANSGRSRETVRRDAWELRRNGDERPLRALIGPAWYHAHVGAVYPQGAILVDHILDAHGPDKFLELYRTCRPGTFEVDCRRILGVGLDELEAACRIEVDRAEPRRPGLGEALGALALGPDVDAERWRAFVREVVAGSERASRVPDPVRVVAEMRWSAKSLAGEAERTVMRWTWLGSGPRRAVVLQDLGTRSEGWSVWSATPERSFQATRKAPGEPWKLVECPGGEPEVAYRRMCAAVDVQRGAVFSSGPEVFRSIEAAEDRTRFRATSLDAFEEPAGRRMRLRVESDASDPDRLLLASECVFDADRDLRILSEAQSYRNGGGWKTEYRDDNTLPSFRSSRLISTGSGQNDRVVDWTVIEHQDGPILDEAFTPEALLDGPVDVEPANDVPWTDAPSFADWYPAPLAAGAVAVVAGLILGVVWGFRRPLTS